MPQQPEAPKPLPAKGLAHLKEKTVIKGRSNTNSGTEKVTGDIVWNRAGTWPEGLRVEFTPDQAKQYEKVAFQLVPMSEIKLLEVMK